MAMHKPGDLVWAKMKGFPPWPAMVLSTSDVNSPTPNGRQPVLFYGTQETAFMKPTELYAYRQFRDQYEVPRKLKGFNQGIREIRMEAGIEEDDDMDAKFPVIGAATPVKSGTMDTRADKISTPSSIPSSSDSDFGQMMRPISDTTLKVFSAASSPSPAEDMLQSVPKLKISFGGMEPIVSTPTALETEATPSMTSSGRVRRPSTKFSPDDYYSMPMDRPKKQQTPVEAKVIKTEVTSSSSNKPSTSGAFSAGKIKFKSMKRKEEREHKKTPEPPSFLFEPIKPEKRPRADSSLRDASKPKRVKRVSISDKISFEPFFSSLPPLTSEAFDICIPSSSSNIVSTMDPTLLSPMLTSAAVPLCDRDDSGNGPLLEPSLVGESSLRHSRRTPKPKSFDDFVTSTKGSGRERASDSISGGLSSVMMRSPARSRGLSISSTRTRLTSGNSDVFEEIGLSIEPLSGFSAADLVSAQAAGYQTIETDDGMSEGSGRDVATPEEPLPMPAPLKLCVECGCECRVVTAHDGSMKWRCTSKYCMKWNGKYEAFSLDTPSSADEKSSKGGRSRSSPRRSGSGTP
uniref:PWWP domain-containing protein n=1 Tax=Plectus sambesii TaxID=2011161 RepID=A0A914XAL7_9BILA